jgi:hypothetical protein
MIDKIRYGHQLITDYVCMLFQIELLCTLSLNLTYYLWIKWLLLSEEVVIVGRKCKILLFIMYFKGFISRRPIIARYTKFKKVHISKSTQAIFQDDF